MDFLKAVELAKQRLGKKYFENLELDFQKVDEANVLKVKKENGKVTIVYNQPVSAFRGMAMIKERADEKEFSVSLKKHFKTNGYMHDCSRNGVVRIDALKELIITLALMGMNRLLLYTEDTYQLEKYPWFGYLRGGYSKDDIKELVAFGEGFGVELIPCIQTLGHLGRPLRWEPMHNLNDGQETLMVGEPKVYEFIEEMIKFCRECFKSVDIHIGMDEVHELGIGKYLGTHPYKNRVELFTEHITKVIKICQKYEFKPMIWSDMYFRLNNPTGDYYRDTPLPESTVKMVPPEVALVYWDYYHNDKKIYDNMISYHRQTKNEIFFAGGAWRWTGFAPSNQGSFRNTVPALESCVDNNIDNIFVTSWGDNGNECSIFAVLPVVTMYSVADYEGNCDLAKVDKLLKAVTDEPLDRMMKLDLPNMPAKIAWCPQYNPCKTLLYQDPMNGIFDLQVKDDYMGNYAEFAKVLDEASKESEKFGYIYKTLSLLCSVLELKTDLGVRLRKSYKTGDKAELKRIANEVIPEIVKRLEVFNESIRDQWMRENRIFGFDVIDGRNGYLKNRLETVQLLVNQYLDGKLEKLEELETKILPFNGHDYETSWNWWRMNVTVQEL